MATELGQAYVQIMPSAKGISGSMSGILDPEAESAGNSAGLKIGYEDALQSDLRHHRYLLLL